MNLLFFGELPSTNIHGVSLSNKLNLEILSKKFNVDIIEETVNLKEHKKYSFRKYFSFLYYFSKILQFSSRKKYKYFYSTFSLSLFGSIKNLLLLSFFKLLNPKGKVVLHVHRGDFIIFYNKNRLLKILSIRIFKSSYKIIFLSERLLPKNLPYLYKFIAIPNTIREIELIAQEQKRNRFIYISNYIEEKGIVELLEAFKKLTKGVTLDCYGKFTSESLKTKILSYSTKNIVINNFISDEQLKYSLISSSGCLVLPSYNEGQPLILLEAMLLGTPVIATHVGDIPDMLGKDYQFLIEPKSVEAIKEAVDRMISLSEQNRNELSNYLKDRFRDNYSFIKHESLLLEVFK